VLYDQHRTKKFSDQFYRRESSRVKRLESELSWEQGRRTELERQVQALQETNNRLKEEGKASRQREDSMNTALLEAERRFQAFKADGAAARVFAESEEVDGKGVSRNSTPAPPLALPLLFSNDSFLLPVPQPLSTTSMILSTASMISFLASPRN